MKKIDWIKEGRKAFSPDGDGKTMNPYDPEKDPYPHDCWNNGWLEEEVWNKRKEENKRLVEDSYDWENPESDPVAAIKQLQGMFNDQLNRR